MTGMQSEPNEEPTFTFPTWRPLPGYELAACKNMDVDAFYPIGNTSIRAVKMVCFWCPLGRNGGQEGPLVDSCVEYEMEMDPTSHSEGIWGGSTPRERERILAGEIAPADLYTECEGCGDPCPVSSQTTFCSTVCKNQHKRRNAA